MSSDAISPRERIVLRAAQELRDGMYVNLGIGMPTLVANHLPEGVNIELESENGLLGIGPFPFEGEEDADLINAGKQTITAAKGASYFSSSESFEMIRGGHIDLTIMGGMEVSQEGDLANWMVPGKKVAGIGGAMDLAVGARKVIAVLNHRSRDGESKLVERCSLPLTAVGCVDLVITDLAVIAIDDEGFRLVEAAPGITPAEVQAATAAPLRI